MTRNERAIVIAIALLALLARVAIIANSHGGDDLRMYTYFSRVALHGGNPFAPGAHGLYPPVDSNNPPLEVAAFTGLLALHDSPTTLRVLFALADVGVVLVIGMAFARPWRWRLAFAAFYAFNPFLLFAWTAFGEDKTLLFLGICAWMLALERGRDWGAWLVATGLAVFKFLGAFAVPALALDTFRRRRWAVIAPALLFLVVFALSNLPWLPHSLDAFSRRNQRLGLNPPLHASPMLILFRLHIYDPLEPKLLTAAAILVVLALFAARRIDMREALALSLFAGYIFLPDDAFNRLLLIALPLMLLLELSLARWIAIWAISCVAALGAVVATRGVPHVLHGIAGPLRTLFGTEGTARHALWMLLLTAFVFGLYVTDRARANAALKPAAAAS